MLLSDPRLSFLDFNSFSNLDLRERLVAPLDFALFLLCMLYLLIIFYC